MSSGRRLNRGDVVLIAFPFSDLSATKIRPALVAGIASDGDLILAFITSQSGTRHDPSSCSISEEHEEFPATGLKLASTIRLDKLVTLDRALARKRIGRIGPRLTRSVHESLRAVFGLPT